MSQRESRLSSNILKAMRAKGAFCFKVHGNEHMMVGLPDLMVCYEGHFIAMETKLPEKRSNTSVKQEYVMEQIRKAGGRAFVVCSVTEAEFILDNLDKLNLGSD